MNIRTLNFFLFILTSTGIYSQSIENKYLKNIRQVTFDFIQAGEGYFSPDNKFISFQAIEKNYPFFKIFVQEFPLGKPKLVSTGRGRTTCSYFSPNGKKLIYASSHLNPNLEEEEKNSTPSSSHNWVFDPYFDIFELTLATGELRQLTNEYGYDAEGSYSPDGTKIVFTSNRLGNPNIFLMNSDGSNVKKLTKATGYNGGPFISSDGKWVIFRSDRFKKDLLQLFAIGIDGSNEVMLTDNEEINWAPYWYPKGNYIIWSKGNMQSSFDLWLMKYSIENNRIISLGEFQITDHPAADVLPVFSNDGKYLMWTTKRSGSSELWVAEFIPPDNVTKQ